jgi:hypothetical protein
MQFRWVESETRREPEWTQIYTSSAEGGVDSNFAVLSNALLITL